MTSVKLHAILFINRVSIIEQRYVLFLIDFSALSRQAGSLQDLFNPVDMVIGVNFTSL